MYEITRLSHLTIKSVDDCILQKNHIKVVDNSFISELNWIDFKHPYSNGVGSILGNDLYCETVKKVKLDFSNIDRNLLSRNCLIIFVNNYVFISQPCYFVQIECFVIEADNTLRNRVLPFFYFAFFLNRVLPSTKIEETRNNFGQSYVFYGVQTRIDHLIFL